MQIEVAATSRSVQGTGASRRLRRDGKVPGVLYGGKEPTQIIELNHNALHILLKQEAFHASILSMKVDGKKQRVLLRSVHMHPWKPIVMHVDFQRVAKDQKIHIKVPLHFINAEIAPGVKVDGGVASHVMNEVEVSCLPDDLPEFIDVDLASLELGDSVHLSDLKFPQGVESTALVRGNDSVVATVQVPKVIVVEEAVPAEAVATEEAAAAEGVAAEGAAVTGEKKEGEKAADKPEAGKKEGGKAPEAGKKEAGKTPEAGRKETGKAEKK